MKEPTESGAERRKLNKWKRENEVRRKLIQMKSRDETSDRTGGDGKKEERESPLQGVTPLQKTSSDGCVPTLLVSSVLSPGLRGVSSGHSDL